MKRTRKLYLLIAGLSLVFLLVFPLAKTAGEEEEAVESAEKDEIIKEEKLEKKRREFISKLDKTVVPAMSFTDIDIRVVVRDLMKMTGVTIVLDEIALARLVKQAAPAGGGVEEALPGLTVTFMTVSAIPFLDFLTIALRTTGLDYKVEPYYIWISDPETLRKEALVTRTIKLRYLPPPGFKDYLASLEDALPPQEGRRIISHPWGSLTITDTLSNQKLIMDLLQRFFDANSPE